MNTENKPVPLRERLRDAIENAVCIDAVASVAADINRLNGFWADREELIGSASSPKRAKVAVVLECIALNHTELSEAVEAVRKTPEETWGGMTKDSFIRELAGTVIRTMDLAKFLDLDLEEAIRAELRDNLTRGYKHGGKAA